MKKILSLSLALLMVILLLCSCTPSEEKPKATRGAVNESTYTNESLGIVFTLPEGWRFYTEDEIAATMNVSKDLFKDVDLIHSMDVTTVIEFVAVQTPGNANNINLSIENLKASGNEGMTLDEYAELSKSTMQEQLASVGYTFSKNSIIYLGANNDQYLKLTASCIYGLTKMEQNFYMRKIGDHVIVITTTTTNNTPASKFEQMIGKLAE